jgi:hypothetical protein
MVEIVSPSSWIGYPRDRELAPGEDRRRDEQLECTVNRVPVDACGAREAGNEQFVLMQAVIKTVA